MALLLKGGPVAEAMCRRFQAQCDTLKANGIMPVFGIVRVGDRPNDLSYERGAMKRAASLGVEVRRFLLPETVSEDELIATLERVNADSTIHGCLLFRPLPPHLDTQRVAKTLNPEKDIDAMTTSSMGSLLTQNANGFAPCTASACLELLRYYQIPLQGKKVAVIGKSMTVGLPTALLMMNEEATVSVCHILSEQQDTRDFCLGADVIISATGCQGLVTGDYVRPGQTVVDVGVAMGKDGKLHGDVDFATVSPIVDAITPVPGGVGAVTSTVLVGHVVEAAIRLCGRTSNLPA